MKGMKKYGKPPRATTATSGATMDSFVTHAACTQDGKPTLPAAKMAPATHSAAKLSPGKGRDLPFTQPRVQGQAAATGIGSPQKAADSPPGGQQPVNGKKAPVLTASSSHQRDRGPRSRPAPKARDTPKSSCRDMQQCP